MRRPLLLAFLVCACTSVESPPAKPTEAEGQSSTLPADAERTTVIGVVHEGGRKVCDAEGKESWLDRYWAVGFVPLVHDGPTQKTLASLEGKVVRIEGAVVEARATTHGGESPPETTAMCPMMQMRSDWEQWPHGIRHRRGDEPSVGTVQVESVEAIEPLSAKVVGDEVHVSATNPFDVSLGDATLIAYYEGCYGKPGGTVQRRPLGTLDVGATLSDIDIPRFDLRDGPRGREHRLDAVRLVGTAEGGVLDLDVPVSTLGVSVACPRD